MRVLAPFVAYAADTVDTDTRAGYLRALARRLRSVEAERPLVLGPIRPG
jgi:putative NADPH-quinone reductase